MKSLLGCAAFAMLLFCGPLSAEEASEPDALAAAKSLTADQASIAPALAAAVALEQSLPPPPPPITLVLKADLGAQRLSVEENGHVKHVWLISSGRGGYATKTGTFRPQWTSRLHHSRQYDWAPMPHAVFFNRGTAFHGTGAVGMLGRPASHGCIRLAPGNAAQLYALVHRHGLYSTKVVVHGGQKQHEPAVARRTPKASNGQLAAAPRRGNYRVSRYYSNWPF